MNRPADVRAAHEACSLSITARDTRTGNMAPILERRDREAGAA